MPKTKTAEKNEDRLTPKPWLIGIAIILALALVIVAYYEFFWDNKGTPKAVFTKKSQGIIRNENNGMLYYELSESYEARYHVSNDYYGKLAGEKLYQLAYKKSGGEAVTVDPELYVTFDPDKNGKVYASEAVSVPSLADFKTDAVYVCSDVKDELIITLTSLSGATAEDFVETYLEKEKYTGDGEPYETYKLRITSKEYGWLNYILYLVRCDNGDYYAYGADDRTAYAVDSRDFHESIGGAVS